MIVCATLVMPFAVAGFDGEAARGLVMPGERAIGLYPHQRFPAWTFTYAPGAVIEMVRRVYELLPPQERCVADELVGEAVRTSLAMVQAIRHNEPSSRMANLGRSSRNSAKTLISNLTFGNLKMGGPVLGKKIRQAGGSIRI